MYKQYLKRYIDMALSLVAVIILSPIFMAVAVLVRIKLGSPVILRQERPGKDEKIFYMYKFRTMTDEKDAEGNLLPDEARLTSFGKKLRSTSGNQKTWESVCFRKVHTYQGARRGRHRLLHQHKMSPLYTAILPAESVFFGRDVSTGGG